MRLTAHTDYALRVLMTLAVAGERLVTIEELARRHRVSKNHLMKVAQTLVGLGFAESVRGRSGGLRLAGPVDGIRIGALVRALEDDRRLVECLGEGPTTCVLHGPCVLKHSLNRALEAFFRELDTVTLADLAKPAVQLRERLGLAA